MTADQDQVLKALDRFEAMVASEDTAITSEFADVPDTRLVGSELGEVATGPTEIGALVRKFFGQPVKITWDWRSRDVSIVGDIAWIFAQGYVVMRGDGGEQRAPYRLTGILERRDGTWRWRHFHGSEPIPDR